MVDVGEIVRKLVINCDCTQKMASEKDAHCVDDPNFAIICAFLDKFAPICGVEHPNVQEMQTMLEDMEEVAPELMDLHIKLMRKTKYTVRPDRWERSLVKFSHSFSNVDAWELEKFGYKKLRLPVRLRILKALLETQFDSNIRFKTAVNAIAANELRPQPLGRDKEGNAYWSTLDQKCNLRIYQEHLDEETWRVVATNREELVKLIAILNGNEPIVPNLEGLVDEDSSSNSNNLLLKGEHVLVKQDSNSTSLSDDALLLKKKPQEEIKSEDPPEITEKEPPSNKDEKVVEESSSEEEDEPLVKPAEKILPQITKLEGHKNKYNKPSLVSSITKKELPRNLRTQRYSKRLAGSYREVEEEKLSIPEAVLKRPKVERLTLLGKSNLDKINKFKRMDAKKKPIVEDSSEEDEGEEEEEESDEEEEEEEVEEEESADEEYSEPIEESVMIVKGLGSGKDCEGGNVVFECSETIVEETLYIYGEGNGVDCDVGNTKDDEKSAAQSKPMFFFGQPGCLKLSPMKQTVTTEFGFGERSADDQGETLAGQSSVSEKKENCSEVRDSDKKVDEEKRELDEKTVNENSLKALENYVTSDQECTIPLVQKCIKEDAQEVSSKEDVNTSKVFDEEKVTVSSAGSEHDGSVVESTSGKVPEENIQEKMQKETVVHGEENINKVEEVCLNEEEKLSSSEEAFTEKPKSSVEMENKPVSEVPEPAGDLKEFSSGPSGSTFEEVSEESSNVTIKDISKEDEEALPMKAKPPDIISVEKSNLAAKESLEKLEAIKNVQVAEETSIENEDVEMVKEDETMTAKLPDAITSESSVVIKLDSSIKLSNEGTSKNFQLDKEEKVSETLKGSVVAEEKEVVKMAMTQKDEKEPTAFEQCSTMEVENVCLTAKTSEKSCSEKVLEEDRNVSESASLREDKLSDNWDTQDEKIFTEEELRNNQSDIASKLVGAEKVDSSLTNDIEMVETKALKENLIEGTSKVTIEVPAEATDISVKDKEPVMKDHAVVKEQPSETPTDSNVKGGKKEDLDVPAEENVKESKLVYELPERVILEGQSQVLSLEKNLHDIPVVRDRDVSSEGKNDVTQELAKRVIHQEELLPEIPQSQALKEDVLQNPKLEENSKGKEQISAMDLKMHSKELPVSCSEEVGKDEKQMIPKGISVDRISTEKLSENKKMLEGDEIQEVTESLSKIKAESQQESLKIEESKSTTGAESEPMQYPQQIEAKDLTTLNSHKIEQGTSKPVVIEDTKAKESFKSLIVHAEDTAAEESRSTQSKSAKSRSIACRSTENSKKLNEKKSISEIDCVPMELEELCPPHDTSNTVGHDAFASMQKSLRTENDPSIDCMPMDIEDEIMDNDGGASSQAEDLSVSRKVEVTIDETPMELEDLENTSFSNADNTATLKLLESNRKEEEQVLNTEKPLGKATKSNSEKVKEKLSKPSQDDKNVKVPTISDKMKISDVSAAKVDYVKSTKATSLKIQKKGISDALQTKTPIAEDLSKSAPKESQNLKASKPIPPTKPDTHDDDSFSSPEFEDAASPESDTSNLVKAKFSKPEITPKKDIEVSQSRNVSAKADNNNDMKVSERECNKETSLKIIEVRSLVQAKTFIPECSVKQAETIEDSVAVKKRKLSDDKILSEKEVQGKRTKVADLKNQKAREFAKEEIKVQDRKEIELKETIKKKEVNQKTKANEKKEIQMKESDMKAEISKKKEVLEKKMESGKRDSIEKKIQALMKEATEKKIEADKKETTVKKIEAEKKEAIKKTEADKKEATKKIEADKKEATKKIEADKKEATKKIEADKKEAIKKIEADKKEAIKKIEADKKEAIEKKIEADKKETTEKKIEAGKKEAAKKIEADKEAIEKKIEADKKEATKKSEADKKEATKKIEADKEAIEKKTEADKKEATKKTDADKKEATKKIETDKKEASGIKPETRKQANVKKSEIAKKEEKKEEKEEEIKMGEKVLENKMDAKKAVPEEKSKTEKKVEVEEKLLPEKLPESKTILSLSLDFEPPATIIKVNRRGRGRRSQEKPIIEVQENVKEQEEPQLEDLIPVSKIDKNQVVAEAQLTELLSKTEKKPPYSGRGRGRGRGGRRSLNASVESDRKKSTRRLGLDIDESAIIDEDADQPVVRQSRRIAQLKIKEEAERRKLEEIALQKMKEEAMKKKKREQQDDYVPSPVSATSESEDEYKKCLEKKKKGAKKRANQAKWHSGTGTSESDEKDEEEEEDGLEPEYIGSPLFKSDHEFSPESDLEDDSGVPTKMARTVRKDPEDDDDFDENPHHACQKCSKHDHPEWILLCDSCDKGYHCSCLKPVLFVIPEGDWFCPPCQHTKLLENLNAKLDELDGMIEAKEKEELKQQRLIFNTVSTDNILPEGAPEKAKSRSRSRSVKAKSSSSSSDDNSSDNEPIYKLRKRRQTNVSYRFNEYDDLINSAIKDEIAVMEEGMPEFDEDVSVTGAGNLGRGKDISTIIEADKEEKLRQLEAQNATKKESKKESDKSESETEVPAKADDSSDSEPIRPSGRQKIALQKKKNRKLNTLDISSEDDGSDEDFQESSPDSEDSAESLSSGSESSMELELLRKKNSKAGITTRRSVRSRHKVYDEDFINDNDSDEFIEPPTKKKRKKEESDFSDFDESDDDEDDEEEDLDSDDLCDDTDTGSDTSDWRSRRKKAPSRRPPKRPTEKSSSLVKKKPKKKDDDEETPFRASSKKKSSDAVKSEEECEVTRRTRGKKINFLEDYYDDSSDDGIKPGVKRPDTPPEEREMFIKKQEEIKRMLAAKNTEGAKEIATPKLEPLRVKPTEFEQLAPEPMSPSTESVPGVIPSDSISTVPPQVIQTAKALDADLHHKIKDTPDYSEPVVAPTHPPAPPPPSATSIAEFDPENMTEEELAKMMEEESFVQHQLKLAGEAIRNKKLKEAEMNRKGEPKEKVDVPPVAPLPTPPLAIPVYTPTHPMELPPEPSQMLPGPIRIPLGPQQLPPANQPHPMQHPVLRPTVPMPYPAGGGIRMPQGPQGLHSPMDQRNIELDPEHPSVKLTKAGLVPKKRGRKSKLELQAIAEAKARADVPYYPGPPGPPPPSAQHTPVSIPPSSMPPSTHSASSQIANMDRPSVLQAPNAIVTAAGEPVIPTTVLSVQGNPAATTPAKVDLDTSKKRGRRKKITPLRDSIPGGQLTTISGAMKGETEPTTSNPILAERLEATPATSEASKKTTTPQLYPSGSSSGGTILSRLQQQMRPLPGPFGAQGLPGSRYFPSPHHLGHSSLNMSLHHLRANFAGTPTSSTPGSSINNGLGERAPGIYVSPDQRGVPGPHGIFRGSGPMYPPGHGYQGQQSLLHHQLQSLDPSLGIRPPHSQEYQSPYLPPQFGGFYAPPSQTTQQQSTATTASSVPATSVTSAPSTVPADDAPATTSAGTTSTAQAPPYTQFETLKSSSPHENASHSYSNSPAHVEPGSSSEFSGLVSYFSSQQDDLES